MERIVSPSGIAVDDKAWAPQFWLYKADLEEVSLPISRGICNFPEPPDKHVFDLLDSG
jgi:hypothetical protein